MPPCQPASPVPASTAARSPLNSVSLDSGHCHALNDEVQPAQIGGVGVDGGGVFDPHREPLVFQVRDEQVRGFDGLVAVPATADHQCGLCISH